MPKTSFKAIQRRPKSSQWPETCLPGGHDAVSAPPKRNCELPQLLRAQMKDGFGLPIDRRCRWSPFGSPNSFSIGRNASKHPSKGDHFRLVLFPKITQNDGRRSGPPANKVSNTVQQQDPPANKRLYDGRRSGPPANKRNIVYGRTDPPANKDL